MKTIHIANLWGASFLGLMAFSAFAADEIKNVVLNIPEAGSVSKEEGLVAWERVYEVASHPRCANCHVGSSDQPMWSGPSYGKTRPHGMNVRAGESRMGVEFVPCLTCHAETNSSNDAPHMAPQVGTQWALAPVEADWFGKSSQEVCNQLRTPDLNGERNVLDIAAHLDHDVILHWAWSPGGDREAAPYSLQEHVDDILLWGVAGAPCPGDEPNAELSEAVQTFLNFEAEEN